MDKFKAKNRDEYTAYDLNAKRYVQLRPSDRSNCKQKLGKMARKRLKDDLRKETSVTDISKFECPNGWCCLNDDEACEHMKYDPNKNNELYCDLMGKEAFND